MSFIEKIKDVVIDLKNNNKSFETIYNKGIDFFKQNQYEQAIVLFEKASKKNFPKPQVFYNLALSYYNLNDIDNAINNYNKFLTQIPEDYDGIYNLALLYFEINKKNKALELFEKCLGIKKEAALIEILSKHYIENKEQEKALALKDELLKTPETSDFAIIVAKAFEAKQGLKSDYKFLDYAIDIYVKVIELNPSNEIAAYNCSLCYSKKGDWENSIKYCEKALLLNPNSLDSNEQMGLVSYCANDMKNAVIYFEKTFELKKNLDYKAYSNLAYAYEKNGETEKSINTFKSLLRNFEDFPSRADIQAHFEKLTSVLK